MERSTAQKRDDVHMGYHNPDTPQIWALGKIGVKRKKGI